MVETMRQTLTSTIEHKKIKQIAIFNQLPCQNLNIDNDFKVPKQCVQDELCSFESMIMEEGTQKTLRLYEMVEQHY